MWNKNKIIEFAPASEQAESIIKPPSPSKGFLPEEYKKLPFKINKNFTHVLPDLKTTNLTLKACVPVFDAMTAGYIITLPCDILVTDTLYYTDRIIWDVDWTVITSHQKIQYGDMKHPEGYEESPYKFETNWIIKTPPGYSVLITHPLNRFDLPFITMSGVVDSDAYNINPVNLPFFLKKDFSGIIKMGTPIAQIIPIKREGWNSKILKYENSTKFQINNLKSVIDRSYKNRFWFKKKYE
jgi:hypothetical protein